MRVVVGHHRPAARRLRFPDRAAARHGGVRGPRPGGGLRLPGEDRQLLLSPHTVRVPRSSDDEALLAVRALLEVPPAKGQESLWQGLCRPGAGVLAVERTPRNITVRLRDFGRNESGDATCDLSQGGWDAQRQQVAWTVRTATGSTLPVRVVMGDDYEKWPGMRAQERFLDPAATVTR